MLCLVQNFQNIQFLTFSSTYIYIVHDFFSKKLPKFEPLVFSDILKELTLSFQKNLKILQLATQNLSYSNLKICIEAVIQGT